MNGLALSVDGVPVRPAETLSYKGMMYSNVPNMASAFGYTNASWTLKCDLTCEYVCRLLNHMRANGYAQVTPRCDPAMRTIPVFDFNSGYVLRALPQLPSQGERAPWRLYQHYVKDLFTLRHGRVDDPALEFRGAGKAFAP
jgi:cation diffusion facilitator CzcD-associated flavoprotein CzcO